MKAFEIIFGWTRGDTLPEHSGYYYVARIDSSGAISIETHDYKPGGGWNTLHCDGNEHEIRFENYFWHPIIRIGED